MKLISREAKLEITPISGVLRVVVRPEPNYLVLFAEIAVILLFAVITLKHWHELKLLERMFVVWGELSAVLAGSHQLSGDEVIEFGPENFIVRKNILGWARRREYPTRKCSELEWLPDSDENHRRLQCKLGWRAVRFGEYISEKQAMDILAALQQYLPAVAQTMGAMPGSSRSNITTLGLS